MSERERWGLGLNPKLRGNVYKELIAGLEVVQSVTATIVRIDDKFITKRSTHQHFPFASR